MYYNFVRILGILRADPKEAQTNGAREWAIEIIEQFSKKTFFSASQKRIAPISARLRGVHRL
jgi:hypothetical protein